MADDEPLDDFRAVAMTAGAAAARVAETILRDQQDKRHRAAQQEESRYPDQAKLSMGQLAPQAQPRRDPQVSAPYDSRERRAAAEAVMVAAGVPDEVRYAKTTADLLNGTDRQLAAAAGFEINARPHPMHKESTKQRSR